MSLNEELIIRKPSDVSDFIDKNPMRSSSLLIVLIALGGIFIDAYDFTSLGIGVVQIKSAFHLTPFELGSVTATMAFGALLGALSGGIATDKVGRYKMFLLDLVLLVISALGAALSTSLAMLLVFRFFMGVGIGLDFPVALSFIAEFVNVKKRGGSINLWQVMWYVAASCTGLVVLPIYFLTGGAASENLWRYAVGFGSVPAFIILILRYIYMKESAPWAAQNLGLNEAAKILERIYKIPVKVIKDANVEIVKTTKKIPKIKDLFAKKYIARTILISIICATQSMEYFAIGFNLPSISQTLFGKDFIHAIIGAILFNLFGIAGATVNSLLTRKMGVRKMAIVGYIVVIISLILVFNYHKVMSDEIIALLIGTMILGHSFGPGSQGMTMAALSYPTSIRGTGTGWGQAMVRVGSILGFYFFPILIAIVGFYNMVGLLSLVPIAGLIAALIIKWEPVGKNLDETEKEELEAFVE